LHKTDQEHEEHQIMREALTKSKFEKIQLVSNHAQILGELEERLRSETERAAALEEELKQVTKRNREKEEKLTKRLKIAEDGLVEKERELLQIQHAFDQLNTESHRQLSALEKLVKTRNDFYKNKAIQQENAFKQQNELFRELQKQVTGMLALVVAWKGIRDYIGDCCTL
jgi:hypothetical protein